MLQQLSRHAFAALGVIVAVALGSDALAQPAQDRGYVGITAGANIERAEDGLAGESAGVGLEAGLTLTRHWALDLEVWVPRYFETNGGRHRDVLFNVSGVRFFQDSGVRPFAVIGAGFGSVQQRSESGKFDGSEAYLVFGGGVQIPAGTRLAIVPEVRVNYAISALVVRPQIGVRVRF
jgi:Outer membrane protein beta-barrel domain